jgi:ribosomal-protein-alanine N-acetyltransferase
VLSNKNPSSPKTTSERPTNLEVRPFARRDLRRIVEIERASFGKDAWPSELFLEYWRAAPKLFLIAKDDRKVAGYSITRTDWRGAELESIAIDPHFRGRGIAQALLQATIARLDSSALRLMVSTANEPALRFYRQFGFIRTRKVANYYGAGRDAWRMRLKLASLRPEQ